MLLAGSAGLAMAACAGRGSAPGPATSRADDVAGLWAVVAGAGVVAGALAAGVLLWSLGRHRRPRGAAPGALPHQGGRSRTLDVCSTVIPLLVVVALLAMTVQVQHRAGGRGEGPVLAVEVTGFQWGWRFRYPGQGVTITGDANHPPTLVLPVGTTVRLRLTSPDVIHAFFVPAFGVKRDLIPGRVDVVELRPTAIGRFPGRCTEFCGLDHWRMSFDVEVVSPSAFPARMADEEPAPTGPGPDTDGPGEIGRQA